MKVIVTVNDVKAVGFCCKGARQFFAKHGLDWGKFVKEGLPEDVLLATGDYMAYQVVEYARKRVNGGR